MAAVLSHFMPAHMPILKSSDCKWLLCLFIFYAYDVHSWLFREWVDFTLPYFISNCNACTPTRKWVTTMPTIFLACSWCLFLVLQPVSGYLPAFISVHNASIFLSRKCVAVMFFLISSLLMTPVSTFLGCGCCIACLHFKSANDVWSCCSRL